MLLAPAKGFASGKLTFFLRVQRAWDTDKMLSILYVHCTLYNVHASQLSQSSRYEGLPLLLVVSRPALEWNFLQWIPEPGCRLWPPWPRGLSPTWWCATSCKRPSLAFLYWLRIFLIWLHCVGLRQWLRGCVNWSQEWQRLPNPLIHWPCSLERGLHYYIALMLIRFFIEYIIVAQSLGYTLDFRKVLSSQVVPGRPGLRVTCGLLRFTL